MLFALNTARRSASQSQIDRNAEAEKSITSRKNQSFSDSSVVSVPATNRKAVGKYG